MSPAASLSNRSPFARPVPMPRPPLLASLMLTALCGAGCAPFTDGEGWDGLKEKVPTFLRKAGPEVRVAAEDDPVIEVVTFWTPAEGTGPSGAPVSGFSGRILMLNAGGDDPVVADGAVRIYLFTNVGTRADQARPTHQIDVTPRQWRTCLAMSNLGPGYEVFVPYPDRPNHTVQCSLRVRFTPVVGDGFGQPLFSAAVGCTLDGPPDPDRPSQGHTMTTETIVPGPLTPRRVKQPIVPASAEVPAETAPGRVTRAGATGKTPGISGLDPAAQARIAKALEALRRSSGDGESVPDFSRNRSPFADAEQKEIAAPRKRFSLAPGRPGNLKPAKPTGPQHPLRSE